MKLNNKQQEILQSLGLTKNQVVLYVECLKGGMVSAIEGFCWEEYCGLTK